MRQRAADLTTAGLSDALDRLGIVGQVAGVRPLGPSCSVSQMGELGRTLWPPDGDPIDCRMPTDIASAFNPPGYYAFVGTDSAAVSTFVFLPWFLLLREISEFRNCSGS